MRYNPDYHHRRSIRLKTFDYSRNATYFITCVVFQREGVLSEIVDGQCVLTPVGEIIMEEWAGLVERFGVTLDAAVTMPNHFHGIFSINGEREGVTLGKVMNAFKSLAARRGNAALGRAERPFWQRNYYEHIVRDEDDLERIRLYIAANPSRWHEDPENPINVAVNTGQSKTG